ncbi:MAG: glycoside hydrolase family 127 protein [Lachnospiraceae bacterium]|nr:glycoside hydrolase family 127 protein [Lachnospiraceae bacterium]
MEQNRFSFPVDLKQIHVTDEFWHREQELVRKEVIPYQWEALNDRIPDAAPSYCMRNFKVAGNMMKEKSAKGSSYVAPTYTFRGFEALPEDKNNPDPDKFYGFVFQDTDFSKWIEAVGYSLTQHPDEELEKIADGAINIVCAAQLENGYLDTYYIINGMDRAFTNLRDHHELYCLGHLIEGAVAYYQATGKDKLLKAAMRFADYCAEVFGPGENQCKGYPGHEIAEMALVRLYEVTGEKKYLDLSKFFIDVRGTKPFYFDIEDEERANYEGRKYHKPGDEGNWFVRNRYWYHQAHKPVREQSEAVGHAVRGVYLYSGMADVARLCGDEELYAACERIWDNIVNEKLYITGGIGGSHMGESFSYPYDLPNDMAYSETCAAIGLVFFARRMLQIKADRKYSDVMEQALYNTVLSGMALDGKSFFYVNPLEVWEEGWDRDERKLHVKGVRQKWFGCACCPPNIARTVSSVASYAYTESEDTLYTHLYMGSELTKKVGEKEVDVKVETKLPWDGKVSIKLHGEGTTMTMALRIPSWTESTSVTYTIAGEKVETEVFKETVPSGRDNIYYKDGYLYITGAWQDDEITLDFDMPVHVYKANNRVRENIGKLAVTRGPITYCLEECDNGKDLHLCRLDLGKSFMGDSFTLKENNELGHKIITLETPGKRVIPDGRKLYEEVPYEIEEDTTLTFVPYYAGNNRGVGEMTVWVRF